MADETLNITISEAVITPDLSEDVISVSTDSTLDVTIEETVISAPIVEETISASIDNELTFTIEKVLVQAVENPYILTKAEVESVLTGEVSSHTHAGIINGFVFVTSVTGAGNVSETFVSGTIPVDSVVESATTDNDSVTISILCEGGANWSPSVTIDGLSVTLTQDTNDIRTFTGSKTITVSSSRTVDIVSSTGATTSVNIVRAAAGPAILTATIGSYPGVQTAAKADDTISVTGTQEAEATHIRFVGGDAFDASAWIAVSGTTFSISGTVSSNSGSQTATLEAKNSLGTIGSQTISSNSITLDQAVPTISTRSVTYPPGQSAFKGVESNTVASIVSDYTGVTYSSPHGDFTIANSTTYEQFKTITCTNPGDYNDSSVNYRIVAVKASNDTSTTINDVIEVADIAPIISVSQPQTRLRSGGNDSTSAQDYLITATSDQNLASAPVIGIGVDGTWQGASFAGSDKIWTRTIQISDANTKGTGAWTLTSATNNAGTTATITGTQNNGGFVTRDITLAAFANEANMNVDAVDYAKVSLTWSVKSLPNQRAVGTTATPDQDSWCLHTLSPQPNIIRILDTAATDASSQASTLTIEEIV